MKYTIAAHNTKLCTNCHKEIPTLRKKCPFCYVLQKQYDFYLKNTNSERNKKLVDMLNTGKYSLEEVGEEFGITRERARQIYKKDTGKSSRKKHQEFMAQRTHLCKLKAVREKRKHVRFLCKECGKPVTEVDDKRLLSVCSSCSRKYRKLQRDPNRVDECWYCHIKFHPYRNGVGQKFCTQAHYMAYISTRGGIRGMKAKEVVVSKLPIRIVSSILRINGKIVTKHA